MKVHNTVSLRADFLLSSRPIDSEHGKTQHFEVKVSLIGPGAEGCDRECELYLLSIIAASFCGEFSAQSRGHDDGTHRLVHLDSR